MYFGDEFINKIHPEIKKKNKIRLLNCKNKNYYKQLINFCNFNKIDILVPGIDEELLKIRYLEKKFKYTKLFLPSKNFINNTLDKYRFYKLCNLHNIKTPKTYLLKNSNIQLKKSIILKPRFGRGSKGIYYLKKYLELKKIKSYILGLKKDYLAQDYINGQEFTVVVHNSIINNNTFLSPILLNEKKGISISGKIKFDKKIISFCKKINKIFRNELIYNIQLIKTKTGQIKIIEINPRVSTTFCFMFLSGYNPFENNNKRIIIKKRFKKLKFQRYYSNYTNYV